MTGLLRLGDITPDGGVIYTASVNVLINGRGAARVGDLVTAHARHPVSPIITGKPTILINGSIAGESGISITSIGDVVINSPTPPATVITT